jgi:hypothetical protein
MKAESALSRIFHTAADAATEGQLKSQAQTDDRMNRIYKMDSAFG